MCRTLSSRIEIFFTNGLVIKPLQGEYITADLPEDVKGHFGVGLKTFVLHQHFGCLVTQPLIVEQLREIGVVISKGKVNDILIHDKDDFHDEKDQILTTALSLSGHINVDDTGARHNGKNGYCTHIGNEYFAWFETTSSKSRVNFLKLLRTGSGHNDFIINEDALEYMHKQGLPKFQLEKLAKFQASRYKTEKKWLKFLKTSEITRKDIWNLYRELKEYRLNPDELNKSKLEKQFNELFTRKTGWASLDQAMKRIF